MVEPETIGEILESETPPVGKSFKQVPARCEFEHKQRGSILSRFVLHYGDFTIKGFRILEGGDGPWVGFPAVRSGKKSDGTSKFVTTTWIVNEQRRIAFKRWVLKCYAASCQQRANIAKANSTEE